MLLELPEMRVHHLDGAGFLSGKRGAELGDRKIGERAAIAYSTTLGTVKKPPAFLSDGST